MRVLMFQPFFATLVEYGTKNQTIRAQARCKVGDTLSLRRWKGKDYRSKQEILKTARCTAIAPIQIGTGPAGDEIMLEGIVCDTDVRAELARADGFSCASAMIQWFRTTHGLPFTGYVIRWK